MKKLISILITGTLLAFGMGTAPAVDSSWWADVDTSSWYAFNATSTPDAGEIGLQAWRGPAGQHGRPTRVDHQFVYHGQPLKFWGFNLGYEQAALAATNYDQMAPFYAKYGVNLIRWHKILEHWSPLRPGSGPHNFWLLNESPGGGMERFDYGMKKLKEAGIYVNFSPSWHIALSPGDFADVPYWEEFYRSYGGNTNHPTRPFVSTENGYGSIPAFIYFLEEFQELKIKRNCSGSRREAGGHL